MPLFTSQLITQYNYVDVIACQVCALHEAKSSRGCDRAHNPGQTLVRSLDARSRADRVSREEAPLRSQKGRASVHCALSQPSNTVSLLQS